MNFCKKLFYLIIFILLFVTQLSFASDLTYIKNIKISSNGFDNNPAQIAANVYIPKINTPKEKFALVIFPNSWGFDQYEYQKQAKKFAQNGFIVLSYSARGWEKSTGAVDIGGENDMADIHAIIDWSLKNLPVNPDEIGMAGISYGAGLSLLGAEHDSRIKAVAAMSGWTNLSDSLYYNNTPAVLWTNILSLTANYKDANFIGNPRRYLRAVSQYQYSPHISAWGLQRSPITYIQNLNKQHTAVFLSANLQDPLFKANDTLKFYQDLQTTKRLDLNQGSHATAEWGGIEGKDNYIWNNVLPWFQVHLQHKNTKDIKTGLYVQAAGNNQPHEFENFNAKNIHTEYFYLSLVQNNGVGDLTRSHDKNRNDLYTLSQGKSGFSSGAYPKAWQELLNYTIFDPKPVYDHINFYNPKYGILFLSNPLTEKSSKLLRGAPEVTLQVLVSRQENTLEMQQPRKVSAQLILYLYEISPDDSAELITLAPITIYNDVPYGKIITLYIPLNLAAFNLTTGDRLGLAIGTQDNLFKSPENNWQNHKIKLVFNNAVLKVPFLM